jgi:hypothetical protein
MENKNINIVNLIEKTPIIQLSNDYQNKFVQCIQNTFTESEQCIFVASFYCYLNYNSKTDFIIEFDSVWKWLGFSRKDHCKVVLEKYFTKGADYKILNIQETAPEVAGAVLKKNGGQNKEQILITVNTFKKLCLKSNTKKADEIHDYYIKMEEILQQVINEESNELKNQLIEKESLLNEQCKLIKRLENKPETEGFYRNNGYIYLIKDNSNIGHYKIGLSENPSERIKNLNCGSSTNSLELVKTFETKNVVLSERLIHTALFSHKIKKQKEWFYTSNEQLVVYFINTIEKCIQFVDKYSFDNTFEELESINKDTIVLLKQVKCVEKCVQTDIIIRDVDLNTDNKDELIFNKFIGDCCIINEFEYISIRELVYQYKTWSKINNIFNYKDFEQYIQSKFIVKKMFNKMFNSEMKCVIGINLDKSFYTFEFKEPLSDLENFIKSSCVKVPTAKLNRSTLKDSYEKWCQCNNKKTPKKLDIDVLCKFLDKYFFKDYFFEGTSSYHGWYGITIKENILRGTGITSTLCKKVPICKVHLDSPNKILQEWDSQKEASKDLGINTSTLKYRLDNKSVFNEVYYLKRKSDIDLTIT